MQTFTSTELNRKSGSILQAAEEQGSVEIRKGSKVYVLQYVRTESVSDAYVRSEPTAVGGDEVVELLREQTALLRELVEQGRRGGEFSGSLKKLAKLKAAEVVDSGKVADPVVLPSPEAANARLLEDQMARRKDRMEAVFKAAHSRPASADGGPAQNRPVVIPVRLEDPKPEPPGEPTQDELRAAYEYFGLREAPDGPDITEKGLQSALGAVKKIARQDPESAEAKVLAMGPADEDRIEFLRCVQLDKLSKALTKRAAGDPEWLGAATPYRF